MCTENSHFNLIEPGRLISKVPWYIDVFPLDKDNMNDDHTTAISVTTLERLL